MFAPGFLFCTERGFQNYALGIVFHSIDMLVAEVDF
jgi:hypothetical protein